MLYKTHQMKGETQLRIWKLYKRIEVSWSPDDPSPIIRKVKAASKSESVINAIAFQKLKTRHVTKRRSE